MSKITDADRVQARARFKEVDADQIEISRVIAALQTVCEPRGDPDAASFRRPVDRASLPEPFQLLAQLQKRQAKLSRERASLTARYRIEAE